jgi:hypothetical protein
VGAQSSFVPGVRAEGGATQGPLPDLVFVRSIRPQETGRAVHEPPLARRRAYDPGQARREGNGRLDSEAAGGAAPVLAVLAGVVALAAARERARHAVRGLGWGRGPGRDRDLPRSRHRSRTGDRALPERRRPVAARRAARKHVDLTELLGRRILLRFLVAGIKASGETHEENFSLINPGEWDNGW